MAASSGNHTCFVSQKELAGNAKKEIPMIALGAKNYFAFEYLDPNDTKNQKRIWIKASSPTLFRYVSALNDDVLKYLNAFYPFFRKTYSHTTKQSYYANTCIFCGSLQGDFHNHEDFGGAFLLDPFKAKPAYVKLMSINLDHDYYIDAGHGGTAYDDIFCPRQNLPA